ncbi:MAG: DUF1573 domain-containing protein [Bacteroidales bacterium]|nr:DUF1573 domain-containing protein [Bacteroidales bacterium]
MKTRIHKLLNITCFGAMRRIGRPARGLLAAAAIAVGCCPAQAGWLETEHNFGAFDEDDGKVSACFRFVNDGAEPIEIEHVASSCGCTVPEYSRQPIAKGDTARITAVYNPTGRPGRFSKSLKVKFSDGSTQRLLIEGVVIGAQNTVRSRFPIAVGPVRMRRDMVTFGAVCQGHIKAQYTEVYNASRDTVVPTWSNVPKYLRIKAASEAIPPGEQGTYSMVLAPTASTPLGIVTDSISFNVPGQEPVKVEIAAIVEEDFSKLSPKQLAEAPAIALSTDMIDFGRFATDGQPVSRTFTITNNGKSTLQIRRIYTSDPRMKVEVPFRQLKKGKTGKVTVTFDPTGFTAPLLNSRLQVITNDPNLSQTTVRLVGYPQ